MRRGNCGVIDRRQDTIRTNSSRLRGLLGSLLGLLSWQGRITSNFHYYILLLSGVGDRYNVLVQDPNPRQVTKELPSFWRNFFVAERTTIMSR